MNGEKVIIRFFDKYSPFFYLLILTVLAGLFIPNFGTRANILNIVKQSAVPMIACVTMSFILITGNIDLSTGYIVGLISCICGIMIKTWELNPLLAIAACLLIGAALGAVNGILVTLFEIPSFIVTLGASLILTGLAQIVSQNKSFNNLPQEFLNVGSYKIGEIPLMVIYAAGFAAAGCFIMHKTVFGRNLRSLGLNAAAGYIAGIKKRENILLTFIISGAATAFCGILMTIRVNCAQPDMGGGDYAFQAITAAVIGGTSLMGGKVNVACCVAGAVIVKVIENCINLLNLNYYLYQAILGTVILLALVADSMKERYK